MTSGTDRKVLVIGVGNPVRGDDGLGPALVARLQSLQLGNVTAESAHQLTIEHAARVAEHDDIVFADAVRDARQAFSFTPISAASDPGGSSHAMGPAQIVALARICFGKTPRSYLLGIRAHRLDDFAERLSPEATADLDAAVEYLRRWCEATGESDAPAHEGPI